MDESEIVTYETLLDMQDEAAMLAAREEADEENANG